MARVGSPAFQPDDQEDKDFFEQLANDLGNDDRVSDLGLPATIQETGVNEAFSKLSINSAGSVIVGSTIMEENGKIDSGGDEFWLEEAQSEPSPGNSEGGIGVTGLRAAENSAQSLKTGDESVAVGDAYAEVADDSVAAERSQRLEVDDLRSSLASQEAGNWTHPVDEGGSIFEICDVNSGDCAGQNVATEGPTSPRAAPLPLDSEKPAILDHPDISEVQASTGVKEVQWSSFSDVFTHEGEQGAFGSYMNFLTDVDVGGEPIRISGSQSGNQLDLSSSAALASCSPQPGWGFESGTDPGIGSIYNALPGTQSGHGVDLQSSAPSLAAFSPQTEWHFETESYANATSPTAFGYYVPVTQQQGFTDSFSKGVPDHQVESMIEGQREQGAEQVPGQDLASSAGQLHGDYSISNSLNEAQGQGGLQQSWENMYPGWFYDYASNEWKQIEGFDSGIESAAVTENQVSKNGSTHYYPSESEVIPSQPVGMAQGDVLLSNATEYSQQSTWHTAQEVSQPLGELSESLTGMESYVPRTEVYGQQVSHNASGPQDQVKWEEQYPGWYYDYQAQEWRQIVENNQLWQSYAPTEDNKMVTSQVTNGVSLTHGSSTLSMPQGGWLEQSQPEYQQQLNQNVYWPGSSHSLYTTGGDVATYSPGVSFQSWAGSNTATQQSIDTSNAGHETWDNRLQSYNNNNFNYHEQPTTDYVQVGKTTFPAGNEAAIYPPHVELYSQAHTAPRAATEGLWPSAGRPPHALVAFVFGGKLTTMKATSSGQTGTITLHDLNRLVESAGSSGRNDGPLYFAALNRQGLAGPLVGGGATNKELFKWIDERIDKCNLEDPYCTNSQVLGILWGVLKIACVHYGKLRSMVGSAGIKTQAEDGPEAALGRLFAATKSNNGWSDGISASPNALQLLPTEQLLQATALEMKKSLVAGKRKEALQLAQQGQLWGPALVLAWQLGEKFYADTVSQMAQQEFAPGSPLRTLFLLFAGQATELFTTQNMPSAGAQGLYSMGSYNSGKDNAGGMLGDWLENLSIIAANRTKGDEQVITHLGDCLWKDRGEVAGAHTCYLVAEANFEPFSKNARLCLVGADHFKYQRTFATPQAIQRTELYEYAKVLGNSQYILVPFQPYKLLYAHMLAEAGKIAEARRYCQAVAKALKNAGRAPEIESCRQSVAALEERLRLHSQGGYSLNSATGKLVGKFIGTIDSTIHRIIGGPPPPQVSESSQLSTAINNSRDWYANDQRTKNTNIRTSSPLVPSASINSFFETSNQSEVPTRSISEPDFSKSPTQENSSLIRDSELTSGAPKHKKTESSGGGYLGRFGSQFFAKAVGFIKPNKKEAKLGDKNKFYYDEKLKRWVEEGAELAPEEVALPPPTAASFGANFGTPAQDAKPCTGKEGQVLTDSGNLSLSSEMPPMPPSINQFSARGRLHGVQSRYVDTFNKGGKSLPPAKSIQSPIVPSTGRGSNSTPAQLFVPASVSALASDVNQMRNSQVNDFEPELLSGATVNPALNGHLQDEHEPLMPKNLTSSFMAVPSMYRHSSASNIALYSKNELAATSGTDGVSENGSLANVNMPKALSWSGDPNALSHADATRALPSLGGPPTMQRFVPPNGRKIESNHVLPAMQAAASKALSPGGFNAPLPSPPIIEPPPNYVGVDNSLLPGARHGHMLPGTPGSAQGGIYGDMQEVEL